MPVMSGTSSVCVMLSRFEEGRMGSDLEQSARSEACYVKLASGQEGINAQVISYSCQGASEKN